MTKKWMAALALAAMAPAAFGQTAKAKVVKTASPAAGQIQILRQEIKRDKTDLAAKRKAAHAERVQLQAQQKTELVKVKGAAGSRAEKAAARRSIAVKYAGMMKDARQKNALARKSLREDIQSKSGMIKKLRQS